MTLKYFEVFFFNTLEFIMNLRASLQIHVEEKNQFDVNFHIWTYFR